MILKNHIAYRFLTDDKLILDLIISVIEKNGGDVENKEDVTKATGLWGTLKPDGQKAFYITKTITEKLTHLKINNKKGYDWKVFDKVPNNIKYTFIFENQRVIRIWRYGGGISFAVVGFTPIRSKFEGHTDWTLFWVRTENDEKSPNYDDHQVQGVIEEIYKILCFFFFAENEEVIIKPHSKYGTKKSGRFLNDTHIPVTIVNNNWNTTSIRTEGFDVSGHFRLQPYAGGYTKMIFIEPYRKHGYIRGAAHKPIASNPLSLEKSILED